MAVIRDFSGNAIPPVVRRMSQLSYRFRYVVIALGANLPSRYGPPRKTLTCALRVLNRAGVRPVRLSPWYGAAAVPHGSGPAFVNAVVLVETSRPPQAILALCHGIERRFGRMRRQRNAPRVLDLDLVDYRGLRQERGAVRLPHPRALERRFVLLPLADVAPAWRPPGGGPPAWTLARRAPMAPIWRISGKVKRLA